MLGVFKAYGLNTAKIQEYFLKIDTFLKNRFCFFYKSLSEQMQELLLSDKNYKQYSKTLYFYYASYLKTLDEDTGGRPELDNTPFRCLHHIVPKFDGGIETAENRCHMHQHEHTLIHLIRFSWTPNTKDLNAFSSCCLTEDQLKRRNYSQTEGSIRAQKQTTQNPEGQANVGKIGRLNRRPAIVSPLQRRASFLTGTKNQYGNSRKRVNAFTWWLCEQELSFRFNSTGEIASIKPSSEPKTRTVAQIAEQLLVINTTIVVNRNAYSNLSIIFRGETKEK
uniref:Putative site-specific DNA endonuclease n=1 Tax=Chaetophora sp. FACHB-2423 TaxID=2725789 RepID=A0A6H1XDT6_9CHLO|nr:putative site-specific DNA endonuclease [Chaetophora sp. FACHB-2423]